MSSLLGLRIRKLAVALTRPACWRALGLGVAPTVEHLGVLRQLDVDGVIDVGANRGQFTLACRLALPAVPIVAFEPLRSEAQIFRRVHGNCRTVLLVESALGSTSGRAQMHVSAQADSSSLLPIGRLQRQFFVGTGEVGIREVAVRRMDECSELWAGRRRQLLKLDVQGYELPVLEGAGRVLGDCAFIYAECSHVALYTGQALYSEIEQFLTTKGFEVIRRANEQFADGSLLQADYLFARRERAAAVPEK